MAATTAVSPAKEAPLPKNHSRKRKLAKDEDDPDVYPKEEPSSATPAEIAKYDTEFDEKETYHLIVIEADTPTFYKAVPGGILKPYHLHLDNIMSFIHRDRVAKYKEKHPGFKGSRFMFAFVPPPLPEMNWDELYKKLAPYKKSDCFLGIVGRELKDHPVLIVRDDD